MKEAQSKEELLSKLAESGIDFDVPDELLEGVAGGYDPSAYNPAAVADTMKAAIAEAKKAGTSKDQMLESYIANANGLYTRYGGNSPEYQKAMDQYRYLAENWG